jgi:Zn-dependent M28 family amino/carboxypeptidase
VTLRPSGGSLPGGRRWHEAGADSDSDSEADSASEADSEADSETPRPTPTPTPRADSDSDSDSEALAAPEWVNGIGFSDHWAFWKAGYPAVMLTDTALFRNPHYHRATDTPETVDFDTLARVTHALAAVFTGLADAD